MVHTWQRVGTTNLAVDAGSHKRDRCTCRAWLPSRTETPSNHIYNGTTERRYAPTFDLPSLICGALIFLPLASVGMIPSSYIVVCTVSSLAQNILKTLCFADGTVRARETSSNDVVTSHYWQATKFAPPQEHVAWNPMFFTWLRPLLLIGSFATRPLTPLLQYGLVFTLSYFWGTISTVKWPKCGTSLKIYVGSFVVFTAT